MGFFSNLFGFGKNKNNEPQLPPPPEYFTDPDYRKTQDFLSQYGQNILEGKPNEYFAPLGQTGGAEFEKVLGLSNRDIQKSALESAARSGRARGGSLASVTSQTIADNTSKLRYADYLRSLEGKKYLFGQGRGITEGVRAAGQQEGANRNTFNLKSYDFTRSNALFDINRADQAAGQRGKLMSNLFKIGAGAAVGGLTGGVPGAVIGGLGGIQSLANTGAMDKIFDIVTPKEEAASLASSTPGVSRLGKIQSGSDINDFLAQYSKRFKS